MQTTHELMYRSPETRDLDSLLDIERQAFTTDHLSRRRMRHWIHAKNRAFRVCEDKTTGIIAGYLLFFYRRNNTTARLYSIAVSEQYRGHGIARHLLSQGEQLVRNDHKTRIQLEVRPDNTAAIALYQAQGYQSFGRYPGFYEDGCDALRFVKTLI